MHDFIWSCTSLLAALFTHGLHWPEQNHLTASIHIHRCEVPSDTVLAVWTFIHPGILAYANRFVQQLQLAMSVVLEPGHICCGSSAHQSQVLYYQMKQWLMIWEAQHIHHQLMLFYDPVVSVSSRHSQQVSANQPLHWLSTHVSTALCSSPHHRACVVGQLGSAT